MMKIHSILIIAIVVVILIIGSFLYYQSFTLSVGPCEGYTEVGTFEQKITSESDAKQIAINYYDSIGYHFREDQIEAWKVSNGYMIRPEIGKYYEENATLPLEKLCHGAANPPECVGQRLLLEERFFGKNVIKMSYLIPC
jgi:hypothetical protein